MQNVMTKEAKVVHRGEGRRLNILGHSATVKLGSGATDGDYYVFEVETPAGAGIPPHVHEHEDEIIQVIEGTYDILLGTQMVRATSGAVIHFPRGVPHGFTNVGSTAGRTLWTVTPGANFEAFFEEVGALPADQPPDLEKVAALFARYGIPLLPPPAG